MTSVPKRPVLRWHGGKWLLAPWIISHFPAHRVYVEPFGGAGSVLMRKPRAYAEVWNDLDGEVVNLFRVLRSDRADGLIKALQLTPFAAAEFSLSYQASDDPVERARRLIIRSFMGFGSNAHQRKSGFRANSHRSGTTPAADWANYPESLRTVIERLRGVTVLECHAIKAMLDHDGRETLHYVDPPYMPETRDVGNDYACEMTAADHVGLLEALCALQGMVVLSGYPAALYDDALRGWQRVERKALADGARARTEVLWINPKAASALQVAGAQQRLFTG
jgi:DNA adenine methylase